MKKRVAYCLVILVVVWVVWAAAIRLAVSALLNSLEGDDISVSLHADLLRLLPGGRRAALPGLLHALESDKSHVRWNAGSALGFLRFQACELTPRLLDLLTHENPGVRWNACFLIGELGRAGEPAIASLINVVEDEPAGEILHQGGA